ncbi:alpha/beta hydrolase [Nonomuraea dietziae]|uniref:S-formylglutathione hydrolase FrmB n=1 Tax=Nonomuraea dietziae TaxID=65515 RepID=A0A7W5V5A2_9ACTN|nr:alpha/beta hydrolase family protein [Nonomuraea dietziae]MBB3728141.1 S-formylglutathione hydrolase FrmB [Nonomuraea dietziae]
MTRSLLAALLLAALTATSCATTQPQSERPTATTQPQPPQPPQTTASARPRSERPTSTAPSQEQRPDATAAAPSSGAPSTRPGGLAVLDEERAGRLVRLTVDSPALKATAKVELLLPTAWRPGTRWPVLYLLDGCCRRGGPAWVSDGRADEVTRDAQAIVVMPEAGYAGFYSDWLDGPQWETFHLTELRHLVERRYGGTGRRAIAGLSMGGFGALSYAARHPGMFRAAASFSGLVNVSREDVEYLTDQSGDDPGKLWGDRIAEHNPTALVRQLRDIPVHVSCGNGEPGPLDARNTPRDGGEAFIEAENRAFVRAAEAAGVKVTANLYGPGTHRWPYWTRELERALPMLLGSLS